MFVNLTDVLTNEDKVISKQIEAELTQISIGGEVFPVVHKTPIQFTFTNLGKGRARIDGTGEMVFAMNCDRCLKPVEEKLQLEFSREVFAPDRIAETSDENDVGGLLANEIVISWPMKVLCKPDCKGICLRCGKDLNTGTCECDTFVPDPRMAVIKDIFNANKEV